jgi:hypothetical protein
MEHTECSETLAIKLHTPENNPKENIRNSKHGESLKSRITGWSKHEAKQSHYSPEQAHRVPVG